MVSKIKTIWKYGIVFGETKEDIENFHVDAEILYKGLIKNLRPSISETVAEIHPAFEEYYRDAMMILYKTYGKHKSGSESAAHALKTLRTKKEDHMEFILIWKIT